MTTETRLDQISEPVQTRPAGLEQELAAELAALGRLARETCPRPGRRFAWPEKRSHGFRWLAWSAGLAGAVFLGLTLLPDSSRKASPFHWFLPPDEPVLAALQAEEEVPWPAFDRFVLGSPRHPLDEAFFNFVAPPLAEEPAG